MVRAADRCSDDFAFMTKVIVRHGFDHIHQLRNAVFRNIVEATNERRDIARTTACSKDRLRHREAQRHVHRNAFSCEHLRCSQAFDHGRNLHDHMLWIDRVELLAIGENLVTRHRDRLGRNGALHDVANSFDMLVEIGKLATDARIERRVGGNACDRAPAVRLLDLLKISGIQKEFHHVLLRLVHLLAVCEHEGCAICKMRGI